MSTAVASPRKRGRLDEDSAYERSRIPGYAYYLTSLPYDILHEIFTELAPGELVSLSKTNRTLRGMLLSDGLSSMWKQALEMQRSPECPDDMTVYEWAAFLFIHECQKCEAKNVRKADFLIRRRLCVSCRRESIVTVSDVQPELPKRILNLLPFTTSLKADFYMRADPQRKSRKQYLYKPDIEPMIRKIAQFEQLASTSSACKAIMEKYEATKTLRIRKMHETSWACHNWLNGPYLLQRDQENALIPERRRNDILKRFIELGYAQDDVAAIRDHPECNQAQELTDAVWHRIRPILEPEVKRHAMEEAERKLGLIKDERKRLVVKLYNSYELTLAPSQWRFLPGVHEVYEYPAFEELINAPGDAVITAANFETPMNLLPTLLESTRQAKLVQLRAMLPVSIKPLKDDVDQLDLATSIFRCHQGPPFIHAKAYVLVGIDDLMSHHCDKHDGYTNSADPGVSRREFSADGAQIARQLVELAGLNSESALASDMDTLDLRFTCKCGEIRPPMPGVVSPSNRAYTWRAAIGHCLPTSVSGGLLGLRLVPLAIEPLRTSWISPKEHSLSVIPEHQATLVKAEEKTDEKSKSALWVCGHCPTFNKQNGLQKRGFVVAHLAYMHGISVPNIPDDMFIFARSSHMHYSNADSTRYDVS